MLIIGEKINGTLKGVKEAIEARDALFIGKLASSQAEAGADYIDVNVGTGTGTSEADSMAWALEVVGEATDKPVALDSADPAVLARGLEICGPTRPFINSVTGEMNRMEEVLPMAARYNCPVVALAMDEAGIPETPTGRLEICRRIIEKAVQESVDEENIYFDPLVLPVSADHKQAGTTLETLSLIKGELAGSKTVLGLSNVSFGLPQRPLLNRTMLALAIHLGLDAALVDPTDSELMAAVYAAGVISGQDSYCRKYVKGYRDGLLG